jgi:signal peptidase I
MKLLTIVNPIWADAEHTRITADCTWSDSAGVPLFDGASVPTAFCDLAVAGAHICDTYTDLVAGKHGDIAAFSAVVPIPQVTEASVNSAGTRLIDTFAQSWGYDNLPAAVTYLNSTIPKFKAEAAALVAWRDNFWFTAETVLAECGMGTRPLPATMDDFLVLMPTAPSRPEV